ncbi:5'-3' exoribonuclease, partial [Kipferlia bialata]|eukprot:g11609.t1
MVEQKKRRGGGVMSSKVKHDYQEYTGVDAAMSRVKADKNSVTGGGGFVDNSISPGCPLMDRIHVNILAFIETRKAAKDDPVYEGLDIWYSGHDVPGEGEHKLLDALRCKQLQTAGYIGSESHLFYGLDADIVLMT